MSSERRFYPLNEAQAYPYEQWWIGAFGNEVSRQLMQRTILDQPVLFYRTEEGDAVAVAALCPHRLFPLIKGRLQGDSIQCGYHGFTFDMSGRCTLIPSQQSVPPKFGVRRYPTVERGGIVWIWTGKIDNADPALLPDLESMGLVSTNWTVEQHPVRTFNARYQLLIDNLLDLSHISFVHAASIPGGGKVAEIPYEIIETDRSINVRRLGRRLPNNPVLKFLFPDYDGPVDKHFDAEFFGPNLIRTGGGNFASASDAAGVPAELGITNFIHGITPQTARSVHYFVSTARNFRLNDSVIGESNVQMGPIIQAEDMIVLESIEANVDKFADTRRELSCAADAGAIQVRRRIAAQIRAELDASDRDARVNAPT